MRFLPSFLSPALLLAGSVIAGPMVAGMPAQAESVVRYGISLADIPLTSGQPDRGAGAYQFTGYTLYDPLVAWEMDVADRPGKLIPGLATGWEVDAADKKKWRFTLREGVKFHDGSTFDADAVIWNLDKVLDDKAPHFDKRQSAQVKPRLPSVASWKKIDAKTVEITTKEVDSFFPYQMLWFLVSSPAQYEKLGRDWDKFAASPSGTGPFKLDKLVPRERAELVKNPDYWNKSRLPKTDRMVLIPMPEALSRTNALLAGQVDLIETPAPDAVPRLKQSGMTIVTNVTPHVWNYHLSTLPGSPWTDVRLRRALNLAIDRDAMLELLNGLAKPAVGQVDPSSPWFGTPSFKIKYDLAEAKRLVKEAGYGPDKPLETTFVIAQGGTGQMLSLPMNEFLQESFKDIGIQVDFKVVELEALYTYWRKGAKDEMSAGLTANNIAYVTSDPLYAIIRFFHSGQVAPVGVNWGFYKNEKVDAVIDEAKRTFDPKKQDELLAVAHAMVVDDAPLVWVVHDTNPHALSPKVKTFVQAQHWFQDLTTIGME
ncbi:ABC transporter substrate-binding protein [Rhodoplanes elegans]|uniref:ABC transporter substrate-binding protein n=1 Tax=Rhodoplanes elegans TaxID=29408 RepID=A0A327KM51_9BRAD|nr:ABC transporter substrate-binding protein [Rhodoplanes elegans]MBK5960695.1 ABC transporter substrate-binding protein [Rhodoplanes elegans]RAI39074.1 ABC transporter substrate-binding protein [Rhodoplanes elegans]